MATTQLYEALQLHSSIWPSAGEWDFLKQALKSILPDLLVDLIPGASVIDIINGISSGNAWQVATGIVDLIIDICPACKATKAAKKISGGFGKAFKVLTKWRFLRNINGSFIDRMPSHWKVRLSNDGKGVFYRNPNNPAFDHIRISEGIPDSPFPSQRVPYVKRFKDGKWLDKNGNNINPRTGKPYQGNEPEVHIPWDEYSDFNFGG